MKVILTKDTDKFGKLGDVVEVKDGFARNYLIPQGKAMPSTNSNLRIIEDMKLKAQRLKDRELQDAKDYADKLSKVSCTVPVQVGPDDKLYGSITPSDIQKALEQEGFQIDKKAVNIDSPMEALGIYSVSVSVHPQVKANVKVWVVKK